MLAGKLTDPQAPMSQFMRVRYIFLPLHACGENYKKNMILQYTFGKHGCNFTYPIFVAFTITLTTHCSNSTGFGTLTPWSPCSNWNEKILILKIFCCYASYLFPSIKVGHLLSDLYRIWCHNWVGICGIKVISKVLEVSRSNPSTPTQIR